jgi:DNA polymerase-3 subunit gamma/tau
MKWICGEEGIEANDEVLAVIAQAGEGSVRDSLSALDQAIACCGNTLDTAEVRALLGAFSLTAMQQVTESLQQKAGGRMLSLVDELERNGQNLQHFSRELSRFLRNLLVTKIAESDTRLIAASPAEREQMRQIASGFSEEDLTRYLQLSLDLFRDLQFSLQPRFHLEIGLLKMVQAGRLTGIEEALAALGAPAEQAKPVLRVLDAAPRATAPLSTATPKPSPFELDRQKKAAAPQTPATSPTSPPRVGAADLDWRQTIHAALTELQMAFTADAVEHSEFSLQEGELRILTPKEFKLAMRADDLSKAIQHAGLAVPKIKIAFGEVSAVTEILNREMPPQSSSPQPSSADEVTRTALENPEVQRFREVFGGEVRTVRSLKE